MALCILIRILGYIHTHAFSNHRIENASIAPRTSTLVQIFIEEQIHLSAFSPISFSNDVEYELWLRRAVELLPHDATNVIVFKWLRFRNSTVHTVTKAAPFFLETAFEYVRFNIKFN